MKKLLLSLTLLSVFVLSASAQAPAAAIPATMPFGKIDNTDLELKACDFEKDANAEILFDKEDVYFDSQYNIQVDRHKRIKIFNINGKEEANVRIVYYAGDHSETISNVQAETFNLENGKVEITKIDKKTIFTERIDKAESALVFSLPNVKPGSVIEFKYTQQNTSIGDFPDWFFQSDLPTRYSELTCNIPDILHYKNLTRVTQPFVKKEMKNANGQPSDLALANIPSLSNESYMSSRSDNLECILYQLVSITQTAANAQTFSDTWNKVGEEEAGFDDFGGQFKRKLTGEEAIIEKAKSLPTTSEKIAYIFNQVKTTMKWDDSYKRYANDGIVEAWNKKLGNSTEINLILCHLLAKAGVKSLPMLLSIRTNGKVNPAYPSRYQFNTTCAYIPVDSTNFYLLDATKKLSSYKDIPDNVLNSFGLLIDKENKKYDLTFIQRITPVRHVTIIDAEIKPNGKMEGSVQLNSYSYNRVKNLENYNKNGEKKYIDYLREDDNNLKISSLKLDNMDVDTLPLAQNIVFNLDLTGSDENYIIFKPSIFTTLGTNPFLSESRFTDIDFGYCNNYSISGSFKLPTGYKLDALPKNISLSTPDKTIVFRRLFAQQDGSIAVRYVIDFKKSIFFKENYSELHEFYKQMYEMLNEQIVLKKS